MNQLQGECSCGMKGCTTTYRIETDDHKPENVLFVIEDDQHELKSFVSLSKQDFATIVKLVRRKFGRLD